jgi:hypothetical protein
MTTSRERALTLALDIVKKQAGASASACELIVLMQERNGETAALRNHGRNHLEPDGAPARHAPGSSKVIVARRKPRSSAPSADTFFLK